MDIPYDVTAYEAVTVSNDAVGIVNHAHHNFAFITVETAAIRYRMDGDDPTATEGHSAAAGDAITIEGGGNLQRFRAILGGGGSDATLRVSLGYRERGMP